MTTIRLPVLTLTLAVCSSGCGRPPAGAIPGTPPTATPATAGFTPPAAPALPGMFPRPAPPVTLPADTPPALQELLTRQNRLHQRQNGARLTITAKWEPNPPGTSGSNVTIDWAIDYDGPRRPFTIITPRMWNGSNQAVAHFWCLKPDGTVATISFDVSGGWPLGKGPDKQRDWFSVSMDRRPVVGQLNAHKVRHLKTYLGRELMPGDPPLWAQLYYAPTDRGDGDDIVYDPVTRAATGQRLDWTLDAWTGKLWSPVVPVSVP